MYLWSLIIYTCWLMIAMVCATVYAESWTWSDYQLYRQKHSTSYTLSRNSPSQTIDCMTGVVSGHMITVDPWCLLYPIELVPLIQAASWVRTYIDGFVWGYQFDQDQFTYTGAQIVWKKLHPVYYQTYELPWQFKFDWFDDLYDKKSFWFPIFPAQDPWIDASQIQVTDQDAGILSHLQSKWITLQIPLLARYRIQMQQYYLTVVERNLRQYGRCSKQNYIVARSALDDLYLLPWQIFQINSVLAGLDGYCQWATPWQYLFYAGVCGVSTQLFRTSLLMPWLVPLIRHSHNERYTKYYGEKVVWDDAAILDYRKQFLIQNQSNKPILIKWWAKDDNHYLIGITTNTDPTVTITKQQIAPLKWQVTKTVVYSGKVADIGLWTSNYIRTNNEQN